MGYTAAQTNVLAQRLVKDLPGLNINVARAWIQAESGGNNNPLGMTAQRGSGAPVGQWISANTYLIKYATPTAGIDAAAAHLKTSTYYHGIIGSLASGSASQQAMAIIASPWNATNSTYYANAFSKAGLLGNLSAHQTHLINIGDVAGLLQTLGYTAASGGVRGSGGGHVAPVAGTILTSTPVAAVTGATSSNMFGLADGTVLTADVITKMMATLDAGGFFANDPGGIARSETQTILASFQGQQWNATTALAMQAQLGSAATAANPVGNAISNIGATLGKIATYLGALILIGLGLYIYSKGSGGQPVAAA